MELLLLLMMIALRFIVSWFAVIVQLQSVNVT
jgi:hypothetical protein